MEWHTERRGGGAADYYAVYADGTVIAYGPERDSPVPGSWIASAWTLNPVDHPDEAKHLGHLAADSPRRDLNQALADWADPAKREQYLFPREVELLRQTTSGEKL